MKKILPISLLILLITQFSCNFSPYLKGRILNTQNIPIKGVEVSFVAYKETKTGVSGGLINTVKTDKDGKFEIFVKKFDKDMRLGIVPLKDGFKGKPIGFTTTEFQKFKEAFSDFKIVLKKKNE